MRNEVSTPDLAEMCRQESRRYCRHPSDDRGHCYELFRRAIVERDQEAWTALYKQYRRLVAKWVVQYPPERVDERVNETWSRFWNAIAPPSFYHNFASIGKVIKFLQMCAQSVCIDERRYEKRREMFVCLEDPEAEMGVTMADPVMDILLQQELFECIERRLRDEQERLVVALSFRVGLAPRQIAQECPDVFADVAEVRRIKERVVLRLSTDPQLQEWWESTTCLGKGS